MSKIQMIVPKGVETWKPQTYNCRVECTACGAFAQGDMYSGESGGTKVLPHTHADDTDRIRKRICFGR